MITTIPITLLTFNKNGNILYRAYSPTVYSNSQLHLNQHEHFRSAIMQMIGYDEQNSPNSTETVHGTLLEIFTDYIDIPINERNMTVYFSLYQSPYTSYPCIHRNSPITFNEYEAIQYAEMQPELIHTSAKHELVPV